MNCLNLNLQFREFYGFTLEDFEDPDFDWSQLSLAEISSLPVELSYPNAREFSVFYK